MKKILSLILSMTMLMPFAVKAEDAPEETAPVTTEVMSETMQRKVNILSATDVLRGYTDGSFRLEQNITRAEFAVLCVRALGYEDRAAGNEDVAATFEDTDGHWAVENIEFAKSIGLFEGSGGYFNPDSYITGNEAVKVAVCMLGYDEIAETNGGWPDGYLKVATELGLLTEMEESYQLSEAVNRGFVVSLMYETLNAPASGIDFESGSEIKYTNDGESILENIHKIYKVSGRVTGTKYTDLYRAEPGSYNGTVVIEDEEYYAGSTDADNMIGYYVDMYYYTESKDSDKTIIYIAPQKKSEELVIEANEVEELKNGKLYYNTGNRNKNASVEKSLLVFYNRRAYPDYTPDDFKIESGNIKLLDGDGNGVYESAFITEYTDIVLGNTSADTMKIIDYFNPSVSVELDPKNSVDGIIYTMKRNGEDTAFSKLSKLDVVSVYKSKDGGIIDLVATVNVLEGTIDSIREESGRKIIYVDGTAYKIGRNCEDDFMIGTKYIFYLNGMNEIAGFELKSATTRFAYLMRVSENEDLEDVVILKVLDSDGKIKLMNTAKNLKIDGYATKTANEIKTALKRDDNYAQVDAYHDALVEAGNEKAYNYAQLLMIKSNADGEIIQIMTEKPYNNHLSYSERQKNPTAPGYTEEELCDMDLGYDGLYRHNLDPVGTGYDTPGIYFTTNRMINGYNYIRYNTAMNSLEGKIVLTPQTKFFIVNTDVDNDEKYSVSTGSAFTDGAQIPHGDIQVYNMNKANEAMAIVYVKGGTGNVGYPLFLVDAIEEGLNSLGEPAVMIRGLYGGEKVSFPCKKEEFAKGPDGKFFEQGDIIRVAVTDNEITASEMKVDFSNISFTRSSPADFDTNKYYDVGKIYNIGNGKITFAMGTKPGEYINRRTYNIKGSVYIYDVAEKEVRLGSSAEIEDYVNYANPNAVACAYLNYGNMNQLVYYKMEG